MQRGNECGLRVKEGVFASDVAAFDVLAGRAGGEDPSERMVPES
jgi:hypothetical protein